MSVFNNTRDNSTCEYHQVANTEIILIIIFAAEGGEALYNQQKQDLELTVVQFMSSFFQNSRLKKIRKATRPLRYDLNEIPYDYTVEVTNRFKGLDQIDRVSEEQWTEVCNTVQEVMTKTIPKKKNARRQSGCLRRHYK